MRSPSSRWLPLAVVLLVTGCGSSPGPITFDSGPPPTSARPSTSSAITVAASAATTAPSSIDAAAAWRDVTGDLAGLRSECGTISFVAAVPGADVVLAGVAGQGLWAAGPDDHWAQLGTDAGS